MFQLFNADCLTKMKDLSANSVDLIICDLPYGCLAGGDAIGKGKERKIASGLTGCSWDIPLNLEAFWKEVKRVRRNEHTPVIHFCTTKFGYDLIKSNEKEFRYDLVWDKGRGVSFLSANKMPLRSHEMVYIFSKAGAYYNRVDISGNFPEGGGGARKNASVYGRVGEPHITAAGRRCVKSVIGHPSKIKSGSHPTEKPLELYKFLIERYCPPGGTVLDPTFGSGNSGLAAQALKRNYIGIEKDKAFFEKFKSKIDEAA